MAGAKEDFIAEERTKKETPKRGRENVPKLHQGDDSSAQIEPNTGQTIHWFVDEDVRCINLPPELWE